MGAIRFLASRDNPRIKLVRKLADPAWRRKEGKFIVEGEKIAAEAAETRPDLLEFAMVSQGVYGSKQGFVAKLSEKTDVFVVPDRIMREISTLDTPPGAILVLKREVLELPESLSRVLVADRIQDPGNMGTLIRSAVAFGFDTLVATKGSVDIFSPKVVRASAGSMFHIRLVVGQITEDVFQLFKRRGIRVYATAPYGGKLPSEVCPSIPLSVWVGNEAHGLPPKIIEEADEVLTIPQIAVESLNVAVSASIIIYELSKAAGKDRKNS